MNSLSGPGPAGYPPDLVLPRSPGNELGWEYSLWGYRQLSRMNKVVHAGIKVRQHLLTDGDVHYAQPPICQATVFINFLPLLRLGEARWRQVKSQQTHTNTNTNTHTPPPPRAALFPSPSHLQALTPSLSESFASSAALRVRVCRSESLPGRPTLPAGSSSPHKSLTPKAYNFGHDG
jgi:hypothetical protein